MKKIIIFFIFVLCKINFLYGAIDKNLEQVYLNFEKIHSFDMIAFIKIINKKNIIKKKIHYYKFFNNIRKDVIKPYKKIISFCDDKLYIKNNIKIKVLKMRYTDLINDKIYPQPYLIFNLRSFFKNFIIIDKIKKDDNTYLYILKNKNQKNKYPQIQLKIIKAGKIILLKEIDFLKNINNKYKKIILKNYVKRNEVFFPQKVVIENVMGGGIIKKNIKYKNIKINKKIKTKFFILKK